MHIGGLLRRHVGGTGRLLHICLLLHVNPYMVTMHAVIPLSSIALVASATALLQLRNNIHVTNSLEYDQAAQIIYWL